MAQLTDIELSWAQGGSAHSVRAGGDYLSVVSGNFILFLEPQDGAQVGYLRSSGESIGCIALGKTSSILAYGEISPKPRIFVAGIRMKQTPPTDLLACLKDGAKLEFVCMDFSQDDKHLVSLSGVPDFMLSVWDWEAGDLLCQSSASMGCDHHVSFNPLSWRQLCSHGKNGITFWSIDKGGEQWFVLPSHVKLPGEQPDNRQVHLKMLDQITPINPRSLEAVLLKWAELRPGQYRSCSLIDTNSLQVLAVCWALGAKVYASFANGHVAVADTDLTNCHLLHVKTDVCVKATHCGDNAPLLPSHCGQTLTYGRNGLYAAGQDGVIRCLAIIGNCAEVISSCHLPAAVEALFWTDGYGQLVACLANEVIVLVNAESCTQLSTYHYGNEPFVGLAVVSPGTGRCVTCRRNGLVETWPLDVVGKSNRFLLSKSPSTVVTSMASSPSAAYIVVGDSEGVISMVDVRNTGEQAMRLLHIERLHRQPVTELWFEPCGRLLVSGSSDGHLFFCDTHPGRRLDVLGHLNVPGKVVSVFTSPPMHRGAAPDPLQLFVDVMPATSSAEDRSTLSLNQVLSLSLPLSKLKKGSEEIMESSTRCLRSDALKCCWFRPPEHCSSFCISKEKGRLLALSSKRCCLFELALPEDADISASSDNSSIEFATVASYKTHHTPGGQVVSNDQGTEVASVSSDGQLRLHHSADLGSSLSEEVHSYHSYRTGGGELLCYSSHGENIITAGTDGILTCWKLKETLAGKKHLSVTRGNYRDHYQRMISVRGLHTSALVEFTQIKEIPAADPAHEGNGQADVGPSAGSTWLEARIVESSRAADLEYKADQEALLKDIDILRRKLLEMIANNANVPEIEKLGHHEFNLDAKESERLLEEGESRVKKVEEELELVNLAKDYLAYVIQGECLDVMEVPGKLLKAFNSATVVENFPLMKKCEEDKMMVEFLQTLRTTELAEMENCAQLMSSVVQPSSQISDPIEGEDDDISGKGTDENPDMFGVEGSRASQYIKNAQLYDQLSLNSPQHVRIQLILLMDGIDQLKKLFNKEFEEVFSQKEAELSRTQERNLRMAKIIRDLELNETLYEPKLSAEEQLDLLLKVEDHEITATKYISPEEQAYLEEQSRLEEARRLAEIGDKPRERALDMMMAGRLEADAEEELFKDLEAPEFMSSKQAEAWTEDEQKEAKEFEKQKAALEEERVKYKKALELELRKLQGTVTSGCAAFDEKLEKLHQWKVEVQKIIDEEELKVVRLASLLFVEEELGREEQRLTEKLNETKVERGTHNVLAKTLAQDLEDLKLRYESMVQDDKIMDRNFKKEFSDQEPYVDALYKAYRKRPRGHRAKAIPESLVPDTTARNPFALRPSSAALTARGLEGAMKELDDYSVAPAGLDSAVWDRLVVARKQKMQFEQEVRHVSLQLAEMNGFYKHAQQLDEKCTAEIETLHTKLKQLRDEREKHYQNLQVQLLFKQGQVEVDWSDFVANYDNCVLINKALVEGLNREIKALGEAKVATMNSSIQNKKGIYYLEWESRKMKMEEQDLQTKLHEIQLLRVTRKLQQHLLDDDTQNRQQKEIAVLEETLRKNDMTHNHRLEDVRKQIERVQQQVMEKAAENEELYLQLQELRVAVVQRQRIKDVDGLQKQQCASAAHMDEIVQRSRLLSQAKSLAQELAVLRTEHSKLHARNFPQLSTHHDM